MDVFLHLQYSSRFNHIRWLFFYKNCIVLAKIWHLRDHLALPLWAQIDSICCFDSSHAFSLVVIHRSVNHWSGYVLSFLQWNPKTFPVKILDSSEFCVTVRFQLSKGCFYRPCNPTRPICWLLREDLVSSRPSISHAFTLEIFQTVFTRCQTDAISVWVSICGWESKRVVCVLSICVQIMLVVLGCFQLEVVILLNLGLRLRLSFFHRKATFSHGLFFHQH